MNKSSSRAVKVIEVIVVLVVLVGLIAVLMPTLRSAKYAAVESTLAWGRNLPARNVVITGVHRGLTEVDELDIIQMAGRAGRYGIDDAGFVYLIIPERSTPQWKYTFENPRPVKSVINEKEILAFHVLAEIQNGVSSEKGVFRWYKRSLAYLQG